MAFIRLIAVLLIGAVLAGCVPWPYTGSCDYTGQPYNSNTAHIATNCSEYCSYKIPGLCKSSPSDLEQAVKTTFAGYDENTCKGFGFQLGSEGMANCLMTENNKREAANAEALKAERQAEAAHRQAVSNSLSNSLDSLKTKPTTTTNCTSGYGGSISCTTR